VNERFRLRKTERRSVATDCITEPERRQVRDEVGEDDIEEDRRPLPDERRDRRDHEPDRANRADPRERDEHVVERVHSVVDDPALEPCVPTHR
jgi:hypothetical protein